MLASFGVISSAYWGDPDAIAFINAAGITDLTQKLAINTLVKAAKANGWWSLCIAIYPIVGGTADTHKYNLKDPQNTDAAYRIVWNGSLTHSSTGVSAPGTATTDYGDTRINPSSNLTNFDNHMSFYSRTNNNGVFFDMGATTAGGNPRMSFHIRYSDDNYYGDNNSFATGRITVANTDSRGLILDTRRADNDHEAYRNGSGIVTSTSTESASLVNGNIYLLTASNGGLNSTTRECAFATIGSGISDAIAALMYTDIQNYQTALGRQV